MKSCKKITALVLALILAFSALACFAGAQSATPAVDNVSTTDDISYSYPSDFYFPETTTTERDNSAIESFVSDNSEMICEISEGSKKATGFFASLFERLATFFGDIFEVLKSVSDLFYPTKPAA